MRQKAEWQKLHSPANLGIDCISHLEIVYFRRKHSFSFDELLEHKDAHKFIIQAKQINQIRLERLENFAREIFTTSSVRIHPL
jgi:hypothetical protein